MQVTVTPKVLGMNPPVLALRLDTPVIVYWDYIILDRLVDYIFREVFA